MSGRIDGESRPVVEGPPPVESASFVGRLLRAHAVDARPLASGPYRRLFIGQGASFVGSMLTEVAVPVQIYDLTKSSLYVGYFGAAGLVPIIVFGLYGGVIADAMDRRKLYFWASVVSWCTTLGLLAQTLIDLGNVWAILGLVAVQSGAFAIASSTRGAIIPRLVEPDQVAGANLLNTTAADVGQVIGPLIAGVLIGLNHGYALAYGIDAVLFTAALYSALRLPPLLPEGIEKTTAGFRALVEGFRFIATSPVIVMSFLVDIVAMVLAMPRALFPALAANRFPGGVGWLYAAIAIGAVGAGLLSGWVGRVKRQGRALTLAVVGWGASVALAGLAHQLWLAVLLLAVAGAADLASVVYRQSIIQTAVPDHMRGRMQGVFTAVVAGGPRLGDLRAGATAAATGLTFSWVGGGVACIATALIAGLAVRSFWCYQPKASEGVDDPASSPTERAAGPETNRRAP